MINRRELFKMAFAAPLVAPLVKMGLIKEKVKERIITIAFKFGNEYKFYQMTLDKDPETGKPWTLEDINSMEFGFRTTKDGYEPIARKYES